MSRCVKSMLVVVIKKKKTKEKQKCVETRTVCSAVAGFIDLAESANMFR